MPFFCIHTCRSTTTAWPNCTFDPQALARSTPSPAKPPLLRRAPDGRWLRARFAQPPPGSPRSVDEHAAAQRDRRPDRRPPCWCRSCCASGLTVLLTQRTAHLTDHAGQVSFPGGRAEARRRVAGRHRPARNARKKSAWTARHVEVHRHAARLHHRHRLPRHAGGRRWCSRRSSCTAEPNEVAEIFEVPLAFLMDGMHHQRRSGRLAGRQRRRSFYAMPYRAFLHLGRDGRHVAQPVPFLARLSRETACACGAVVTGLIPSVRCVIAGLMR